MNLIEARRYIQPQAAFVLEMVDLFRPLPSAIVASDHYKLRVRLDQPTIIRTRVAIELIQDCNNMGRHGQASKFAQEAQSLINCIADSRIKRGLIAHWLEKRAWIADYEGNPKRAIRLLTTSRNILEQIPQPNRTDYEDKSFRTTTHFLGRQHYLLASFGVDKDENIDRSIRYFKLDLTDHQQLREKGEPNPAVEFFNHAWLARAEIIRGDFQKSRLNIVSAQYFVNEFKEKNPEGADGLMAHLYLLTGEWQLKQDKIDAARQQFQSALDLRKSQAPYPKGEADAVLGIAATFLQEKDYLQAIVHVIKAVSKYKFSLLRAALGG